LQVLCPLLQFGGSLLHQPFQPLAGRLFDIQQTELLQGHARHQLGVMGQEVHDGR
jgi:hypothetical protein